MPKILYICPKYPYPKESGEDFGYDKDIKAISNSKYNNEVLLLMFNRDKKDGIFPYTNVEYQVFINKEKVSINIKI